MPERLTAEDHRLLDELQADQQPTDACPLCGSVETDLLGTLGTLEYLRCRRCGWDFPHTASDD